MTIDPLLIAIVLALIATCVALMLGVLTMSSGTAANRELSTPLMWARVGFQGFTLLLLAVAIYLR